MNLETRNILPEDYQQPLERIKSVRQLLTCSNITARYEELIADPGTGLSGNLRRFDPAEFTGIRSLKAALRNLQMQEKIDKIVIPRLSERLKAAQERRNLVLSETVTSPEKSGLFDVFDKEDLNKITFYYREFQPQIERTIGPERTLNKDELDVIDNSVLAEPADTHIPRAPRLTSQEVLASREQVINKLQKWLDAPNLEEKMLDVIDQVDEHLWNLFDSIVALNKYLKDEQPQPPKFPSSLKGFLEAHFEAKQLPSVVDVDRRGFVLTPLEIGPKAIEQRDSEIRDKINAYYDDILTHDEFQQNASPGTVVKVYPRLTQKTVDSLVDSGFLPFEAGRRQDQKRFSPIGIATALYLRENAHANLPTQLKKQVQTIAAEEFEKRQPK